MKQLRWLDALWTLFIFFGILGITIASYWFETSLAQFNLYYLTMYGVVAFSHLIMQMVFAVRNDRRWNTFQACNLKVAVIVPNYKEDPQVLKQSLISIKNQTYPQIKQVIVTQDGQETYVQKIFEHVSGSDKSIRWQYLANPHAGKRHAMYAAFNQINDDIDVVFNIDGDTILNAHAISEAVKPFYCPQVGGVTGDVRVLNNHTNVLTQLTGMRYWFAFWLERASQSNFGVMACMSGPLAGIRKSILDIVKEDWVHQTFLGKTCTYGDDRRLTAEILKHGHYTVFISTAIAYTEAPIHFTRWAKQQLRWSRSFWREYLESFRWLPRLHPFFSFDLLYQGIFPFFVFINVIHIGYLALTFNVIFLQLWFGLLITMGVLRAFYGVIKTKNIYFLHFSLYALLFVGILLPIKLYALATIWNTSWGTRPQS